jgi:Reverse transcriptase (RNA-dependent DNA polymerase)
MAPCCSVGH